MKRFLMVSESNDPKNTIHRLHLLNADDPSGLALFHMIETPSKVLSLVHKERLVYCSMSQGFSIYDVASPGSVKQLSFVDLYGGIDMKLSIDGSLAYLTSWKRGITIVDVHDPCNPFVVGRAACNYEVLPDDQTPYGPYGVAGISVHGNYAFCVTCDYSDDKRRESLIVYDVADPYNPFQVEIISTAPWRNHGITTRGNYAYTSGFEGILIYDISDPTDPIFINRYEIKERMCCVSAVKDNLLFTVGSDYAPGGSTGILSVFDIRNPLHMKKIGETVTVGRVSWNLRVRENNLYVVGDTCISTVDITDPEKPTVKGLYGPSGANMVFEVLEIIDFMTPVVRKVS